MKKALRENMIKARLEQEEQDFLRKSATITETIKKMEEFQRAETIMIYLDFRKEVKMTELVRYCIEQGKVTAVPLTVPKDKRLIPSVLQNFPEEITKGAWGIPEPKGEYIRPLSPEQIDLVIVPGVAYDLAGNRLGYGGGFYDRFLCQTKKGTVFIAPAFEFQIIEKVYPEEHDCPVHYLITEERIIRGEKVN